MNVFGIVCEYNPFHLGHLYHIEQTRLMYPEESAVVCVMGGEFVQRGDAAIFDAHARAEAAVLSGADLVLELPLPWALSSAENFGFGAAAILDALGIVTHMSFGSECGDIGPLTKLAQTLSEPEFDSLLKSEVRASTGSFAASRQKLLREIAGDEAGLLSSPNNILAVEYIKALIKLDSAVIPVTLPRSNEKPASELRSMLFVRSDVTPHFPKEAMAVYEREMRLGRGPVSLESLEQAILSRLRALPAAAFDSLPDASEGLQNRLRRAAYSEPTLDAVFNAAKSKRYAMSRLRRMLLCAALGITADTLRAAPGFTKLLAANSRGLEILRLAKTKSRIQIITKPASAKILPANELKIFELGCAAADLYALGFQSPEARRGGESWRKSPFILK